MESLSNLPTAKELASELGFVACQSGTSAVALKQYATRLLNGG